MPEDVRERLLPGEEPQLVIHLAWYRRLLPTIVFRFFYVFLILAIIATIILIVYVWRSGTTSFFAWFIAAIPLGILLVTMFAAIQQYIRYQQWRLMKTNARLMISLPQPGTALPLADNVDLRSLPAVLDVNWSPNLVWRMFQFFTGARDVYISLVGYRFVEGRAKVGDALIFPDVMPEDIAALRRQIFKVPNFPF